MRPPNFFLFLFSLQLPKILLATALLSVDCHLVYTYLSREAVSFLFVYVPVMLGLLQYTFFPVIISLLQ